MRKQKTHKNLTETIFVREEFVPYETKPLDSKHRITLGNRIRKAIGTRLKVDSYQVLVGKQGDILLRPAVSIPSREAWIYQNPEVIAKIRKGLQEAGEGKTERVDDLDSFLESL